MTKPSPETEETVEVDGETYALNDHVYLSAPWNASDGAPWLIGRIMEFIREPAQTGPPKKKKARPIVQLKLAHYHRQRDLISRHIIDCRLLAASMTFDIFCVSRLRGKCRVEFKGDRTPEEVEGWKATPNCFYFSQVYGRYTHRHYDLILTQNLKNAPPEVIQFLRSNYSYIFAEIGMGPELSEERRGCITCRKWTSGADSVTCALCNAAYHFACLNPPLIRKPERGYRWACAPCSKKRQETLDDHSLSLSKASSDQSGPSAAINGVASGGSGRSLRDKGKKKEVPVATLVQAGAGPDGVLRTVDGWPFRYYGQYTQPTSVLDPMDSPYLYTAPRIGSRFQTSVPDEVSNEQSCSSRSPPRVTGKLIKGEKRSRDGTPLVLPSISTEAEFERGGDETVDVISTPDHFANFDESALDAFVREVVQLPLYRLVGVTLIDKALISLRETSKFEETLVTLRELTAKSLGFMTWSEAESNRMENAISQLGEDIRGMLKLFPKKTWVDVTRFYYMFKGHKFPETSAQETRLNASVSQLPDENLAILPTPSSKRPYTCVVCEIRTSTTWRRCPDALMAGAAQAKKCICHECHLRWRKYGLQHVPVAEQEDYRGRERKSRGSSNKNTKIQPLKAPAAPVSSVSTPTPPLPASVTPPPAIAPIVVSTAVAAPAPIVVKLSELPIPAQANKAPLLPVVITHHSSAACVLCNLVEPSAQLARCTNCTLTCHTGCVGLEENIDLGSWQCLACKSIDSKTVSKVLCCSLCQNQPRSFLPDEPLTALDVWKLSEYNSFVHMLCALWHAELAVNASIDMVKIEGFANIPLNKRKRECVICNKAGIGACTKCDQCSTCVHVSCAWSAGYKFGFEMLPQRKRRPRESDLVKFGERTGLMETRIWCPEHQPGEERATHGLSEQDPETKMTALQTYIRHRKQIGPNPNLEILRKARRLEGILESVTNPKNPSNPSVCGKAFDIEDGYGVAAISKIPETQVVECPTNGADLAPPVHTSKPIDVNSSNISSTAPRPRVRNRSKSGPKRVRNSLGTSKPRVSSKIVLKTSLSKACPNKSIEYENIPKPESEVAEGSVIKDSTGQIPVTVSSSVNKSIPPQPIHAPPPIKSVLAKASVELEKPKLNSPVLANAKKDHPLNIKLTPLSIEKKEPSRATKPLTTKRGHKSGNTPSDREAPAPKRIASKSNRPQHSQSAQAQAPTMPHPTNAAEPALNSLNGRFSSKVVGSAPGNSTLGHHDESTSSSNLPKPHNKLRLTIKPTLPPPPAPLRLMEVEPPPPRMVPKPSRPTLPQLTSASSLVESEKPAQRHPNKPHRPTPPPPPPTVSLIEADRPPQDPSLSASSTPTFAFLPSSNLSHHQISQPSRPLTSSSSGTSPSTKPKMTRLPSINHLDAFNPAISRLHSLPHVSAQLSAPVYLPPISSVAPRRRSPSIGLLPTSVPPIRHPSPAPGHMNHPPSHFRFAAPLSNPPSFDAFARGAAATNTSISQIRHESASSGHTNTSVSPVPAHPPINHSPPPPRHNILT